MELQTVKIGKEKLIARVSKHGWHQYQAYRHSKGAVA